MSSSETLYDELHKDLVQELEDTSKIRTAAARNCEKTVHSFGQEDIYIRWALDSLSRSSCDHDIRTPLFKEIATIFFGSDTPVCSPRCANSLDQALIKAVLGQNRSCPGAWGFSGRIS